MRIQVVFAIAVCALAARETRAQRPLTDSAAAVRAVEQFHAAIAAADTAAVQRLLHASAVVLESGDLETRAEYFAHHLAADIAFARGVPSTRSLRSVTVRGDAAWVVATSRTTGKLENRDVDSDGAELMVLRRDNGEWRIAAIHWSSRRHRP
jgi:ketosteroid isomerase-like protein